MFLERETEVELLEGCLQNVRKAQKKLYYKYCNAMYSIAFRILKNEDDASDALQEAFIQVFKDLKTFRKESTIGAWIKTIVIRTALRKLKKNVFTEEMNDRTINMPAQNSCTLTNEYIEKTILALPTGYRTVFLLIEVEGYSHKEVAEMLKISEGTSKSQLFYAKKHLRNLLKDLMY